MKICAATGNPGKLKELRRILEKQGHQVLSQNELGLDLDPEETGATFAENAAIKAAAFAAASGLPTVADDSGLCVDALGGAPGVYSARYCGHHGDDAANNALLLAQIEDIPDAKRTARFRCAAALVVPSSDVDENGRHRIAREIVRNGEMPGVILRAARGEHGFGYDPLFVPDDQPGRTNADGEPLTSAEMTPEEKNAISHRGKALRALMPELAATLL